MNLLSLTPEHWAVGLGDTCVRLRRVWAGQWPGLPAVHHACLDSLGLLASSDSDIGALNRFGLGVAQDMEALANGRPSDTEPAYHNRLHTADVLVAMTTLLHAAGAPGTPPAAPWAALLSPLRWRTTTTTRGASTSRRSKLSSGPGLACPSVPATCRPSGANAWSN